MGKRQKECRITGEIDYVTPCRARKLTSCRDIHVAALVHALIIIFLAGRCLNIPTLNENRAFGWHDDAGFVIAVATG